MKARLRYKKNPHQREFHEDLTTKIIHLSTGFGGGKSFALCMKALQLSAINKHTDGGLLCPTYGDFKTDILPLMDDILTSHNIPYRYHGSDHYFTFPWSKKRLWIASGEIKLRGPNWGYAVANEITLIPFVRFKEMLGRVRDRRAVVPQIACVGTPEGVGSEYYGFFIESPPQDAALTTRVIYGNTRDNAHNLDPSYIPMLENSYDKTMLNAYLEGQWVNMNGNQFYYSYDPVVNEDNTLTRIPNRDVHCFLDFNVRYMTCTLWNLIDLPYGGQRLVGIDEIVIPDNADTYKMVTHLQQRGYLPENTIIYPDPAGGSRRTSGKADHAILREAGYEVISKRAAPRMRDRQLNVNNLLDKGHIVINPVKQPTLRRDLQAVEQNQDTLDKNKKNEKLTHASDGLDYGCDILFPSSGKRQKSAIINYR